jgi:crescentin
MMKLGSLLNRKTQLSNPPTSLPEADHSLDLDEELFSARGVRLGAENEALRNLLIDASAKIDEIDAIKAAVGKLIEPIGKVLRAIETEQAEKTALQSALNNTRTAYAKLRSELAEQEKKLTAAEAEGRTLRQQLGTALTQLKTAENAKAEITADIAARRAQIVDLEARLVQESGEHRVQTEENRRLNERLAAAEKRIAALESDLNGARQRLLIADDEKRAQQTMLERASGEAAQLARKLAESEAAFEATQRRLRQVEANFAELSSERNRLAGALDEANARREHELGSQRMRFEALQARTQAGEKLLGEARDHLLARAEETSALDRRLSEVALERDGLQARLAEIEAERIERQSAMQELDHACTGLNERANLLTRAFAAKESALEQAEQTVGTLNERIGALEQAMAGERQLAERTIEDLKAALRREQMEHSVVQGALDTARKDFSRVMRELMALQRQQQAAEAAPQPAAANAA